VLKRRLRQRLAPLNNPMSGHIPELRLWIARRISNRDTPYLDNSHTIVMRCGWELARGLMGLVNAVKGNSAG
jgi:hypothetical protein